MKIPLLGTELFHAGGRTDRHEANTLFFRNFVETHKNQPTELLCSSITRKISFSKYCNSTYYSNAKIHKNSYE